MPTSPLTRWARALSLACQSDRDLSDPGSGAPDADAAALPSGPPDATETILHASCVAHHGRGVLILGASGRGKSALALHLMALGARLVADDRCILRRDGPRLTARAPDPLRGLIEARFVGLLTAEALPEADITLIVDLDQTETTRLPPARRQAILGLDLPVLHFVAQPYFPAAILQYITLDGSSVPG